MAKLKKATVIATGKQVEVYISTLKIDVFIDFADCKTTYKRNELKFK